MARDAQDISRRQFLRGDYRGQNPVVRPPWATAPSRFLSLCDRCGQCRDACARHLILLTDSGYPRIDFQNGECTFCGDCAGRCPTGALRQPGKSTPPWSLHARVGDPCLARHGVVCLVCGEQCLARAISFPRRSAAVAVPAVDAGRCSGCGACVAPCPAQAISMEYSHANGIEISGMTEEVTCT